jgi:valyl-tRNA synthetase
VAAKARAFHPQPEADGQVALEDRWMASRLNRVAGQINAELSVYRFDQAAHLLYQFFWGEFCDWYIELAKLRGTPAAWANLTAAFENALRLLHPIMPFVTEELWQALTGTPDGTESIAVQPYPACDNALLDDEAETRMAALQEAIAQIRAARVEMKVEARRKIAAEFFSPDAGLRALASQYRAAFERLAEVHLAVLDAPPVKEGGVLRHTTAFDLRIPYAGTVDTAAERQRLQKEMDGLRKQLASLESQLGNAEFRAKAPEKVVSGMEQKLRENQAQQRKIEDTLAGLG